VASEILKAQIGSGRRKELYYFRDQQGLEVDFVVPCSERRLIFLEAKASRTATPQMGETLVRLSKAVSDYRSECVVVHRASEKATEISTLRPGVSALPLQSFLSKNFK
jgi:predicted AAA+ superfamily ATPase